MRARQGVEEEAVSLASLGAEVEELVGSEEDGELAGLVEKSLTHIETSGGGIWSHQRDQHCTFLSCLLICQHSHSFPHLVSVWTMYLVYIYRESLDMIPSLTLIFNFTRELNN